jgi:hypothetical protein
MHSQLRARIAPAAAAGPHFFVAFRGCDQQANGMVARYRVIAELERSGAGAVALEEPDEEEQ